MKLQSALSYSENNIAAFVCTQDFSAEVVEALERIQVRMAEMIINAGRNNRIFWFDDFKKFGAAGAIAPVMACFEYKNIFYYVLPFLIFNNPFFNGLSGIAH